MGDCFKMYSKKFRIQGFTTSFFTTILGTLLIFYVLQQNSYLEDLSVWIKMSVSLMFGGTLGFIAGLWLYEKIALR